jgi:hypothetical protein
MSPQLYVNAACLPGLALQALAFYRSEGLVHKTKAEGGVDRTILQEAAWFTGLRHEQVLKWLRSQMFPRKYVPRPIVIEPRAMFVDLRQLRAEERSAAARARKQDRKGAAVVAKAADPQLPAAEVDPAEEEAEAEKQQLKPS